MFFNNRVMIASLFKKIADLLADLPNLDDKNGRRAFMLSAGLDEVLIRQIDAAGPSSKFFPLFVEKLGQYGKLANGELALVAVLTAAQEFVGQEKKVLCQQLMEQVQTRAARLQKGDLATPELQCYKAMLQKQHGNMNILSMTKPMPLEGFFTQVNVLSKPAAFRLHQKEIEKLQEVFLGETTFGESIEKGQDGLQVVRENHRLFILGKPGAGKTTFLKYVMLQALAGKLDPQQPRLPILIMLRDLPRTNINLLDFIVRLFESCDFPDARLFVTSLLNEGCAIVMFDGLDEALPLAIRSPG